MADLDKIKTRIRGIAESRTNVTIEDIEWVVSRLGQNGFKTDGRPAGDHQTIFTVEQQIFGICTHHRGSRHLEKALRKPIYKRDERA